MTSARCGPDCRRCGITRTHPYWYSRYGRDMGAGYLKYMHQCTEPIVKMTKAAVGPRRAGSRDGWTFGRDKFHGTRRASPCSRTIHIGDKRRCKSSYNSLQVSLHVRQTRFSCICNTIRTAAMILYSNNGLNRLCVAECYDILSVKPAQSSLHVRTHVFCLCLTCFCYNL